MIEFIDNLDKELFWFIHYTLRNNLCDFLAPIFRNKLTWIPLYLWLAVYINRKKKEDFFILITVLVLGIALNDFFCSKVLKLVFERIRPCFQFIGRAHFKDFHLCSDTFSMPSSHAANHAFIAWTLIQFFKTKGMSILLVLWVILISFSQVYVGVHFPGDVLVGMLVGVLFSTLILWNYQRYAHWVSSFTKNFYK